MEPSAADIPSGLDDLYVGRLIPLDGGDLGPDAAFGSNAQLPCFMSLRRNLELDRFLG
jgi:hypothetical protein